VGSTTSISGGGGYSQANYSLSLLPGTSRGVTEGKGEAVMSATAYRFCPEMLERRRLPESLYDRIRVRPQVAAAVSPQGQAVAGPPAVAALPRPTTAAPMVAKEEEEYVPSPEPSTEKQAGIRMSQELYNMAGFSPGQTVNNVLVR
jgi:peptidoglycan hydrolase-like protein with peptidoglycan-binding domain